MMTARIALLAGLGLLAAPLQAKDASYIGSIETVTGDAADMARGTVFEDANRNSRLDEGEQGIEGVMVSNGREVVVTGADGTYELPAYDDMNVFVTKPRGFAVPVSEAMIPQFNYVHKVDGSPDLRFGGIDPTGPLPAQINFPLVPDNSDRDAFQCLAFGDVQAYNNTQMGYVRDTAGKMLATRDMADTECLLFEGDVMGDDLSLYPRFAEIIALGRTPQYWIAGNHDIDFDAEDDQHSFDTFRREFGPEYYSFDVGNVHFVVLDNVRYPCNGVDDHPFCDPAENPTYNGVIAQRQLDWLEADLAAVPQDSLIVLNAHIPFQTFTDNTAAKHQTDNLADLVEILGDRPTLGLSGHTHTVENIVEGEHYEGWEENTGVGPAPFHQIVTGALSGSWWSGEMGDNGVPSAPQRLGAPRGYFQLAFDGAEFEDTYLTFTQGEEAQLHAGFSTPRFRDWTDKMASFAQLFPAPTDVTPPVTVADLGDQRMITRADLEDGTWVAVNVWNGSKDSEVAIRIDEGEDIIATRTQSGTGEAKNLGTDYADPVALAQQGTDARQAVASAELGRGYEMFQGEVWGGAAGPLPSWLHTTSSIHLWRADLPTDLPVGAHVLTVETTDRFGRAFEERIAFEVVGEVPDMTWQESFWEDAADE